MTYFWSWKMGLSLFGIIGFWGIPGFAEVPSKQPMNKDLSVPSSPSEVSKVIPFSGYEDRLRRSPRWKSMSKEEREEALQTIQRARSQFLERQKQLEIPYKELTKKKQKTRKSLIKKRRRREVRSQDSPLP